jgi:glycoside/pentoside/hexuronide:cation symporter, GPH family
VEHARIDSRRATGNTSLPRGRLAAYSIAELPVSMISTSIALFLPAFYTQDLGLGMAAVGAVLMIARFWDVFTDPVIGYLSDRTRSRFGRRKPWVVGAMPLAMLAIYHLYFPPENPSNAYLLGWIVLFWLGWTLFNIPYFAWGAELSTAYTERTRITGWRTMAGLVGTVLALAVPAVSQQLFGWGGHTGEIMWLVGIIALVLMPLCTGAAAAAVPERSDFVPARMNVWAGLRIMWSNAPFRRLLFAFSFSSLAVGLTTPLFVLFVAHIILEPTAAPKVVLCYFAGNLIGVPLWIWLAGRTDKHITWLCSISLMGVAFPQFVWLGPGDVALAALLLFVIGIGGGNTQVVPSSMKADVIDLDALESGEDRAGLFFAAWSTATKVVAALGVGISMPILAWFGFDPTIVNAPEHLRAFQLYFSLSPPVFYLLSAMLVIGYPITRNSHRLIRERLEAARRATDGR